MVTTTESKFARGVRLIKISYRTLLRDKRLLVLAAVALVVSFGLAGAFMAVFGADGRYVHRTEYGQTYFTGWGLVGYAVLLVLSVTVANLFSAALIYASNELFNGRKPTLGSCGRAVVAKLGTLLPYSLFMATVGFVIALLIQRLPFGGKLLAWLAGLGWQVANFFSVAVIMLGDEPVTTPLDATKRSSALVKKVWGEGVVSTTGVGIVALLPLFAILILFFVSVFVGVSLADGGLAVIIGAGVVLGAAYLVVVTVMWTVNVILTAALYHYATIGSAPLGFDNETLQASLGRKKKLGLK